MSYENGYNALNTYNNFNSKDEIEEGRKPKFGEPTFVASVRLPASL